MSYAKGYRPDPPHRRSAQTDFAHRRVRTASIPDSASLEHLEHQILDQNQCGSCTGHGTAQALWIALASEGTPLSFFPSPMAIYQNTRCVERPDSSLPLTDSGAMPSDIITALREWGIREMRAPSPLGYYTDVDASNVNDEPKLDDLETEARTIIAGEYRIDDRSTAFIDDVCSALAGLDLHGVGVPVGIGVFVDTAFEEYDPSNGPLNHVNMADPAGGGHWIVITSYRTDNGKLVFRGPNSWGPDWGDHGHFEVTEDWLRVACSDCIPFTSTVVQ